MLFLKKCMYEFNGGTSSYIISGFEYGLTPEMIMEEFPSFKKHIEYIYGLWKEAVDLCKEVELQEWVILRKPDGSIEYIEKP